MSPVRTAPNERIAKDFWTDRHVQRLPYLRGFLFATNLNASIKKASGGKHSLDDVVHGMFKASAAEKQELSFDLLSVTFKNYLTEDPRPSMTRQLLEGELVALNASALGPQFGQSMVEMPVFELGFDFDKFAKDRIVADLNPNSSAYAAGLRNGQKRNGEVSLAFGDTTKEVELKVKDEEGEKTIMFLPVSRDRAAIPQFKLAP